MHPSICLNVLREYSENQDYYIFKNPNYPTIADEADQLITILKDKPEYKMIIFDEASRIFPTMRPLRPAFRSFLDVYRHYDKSMGFICRRPTQLYADIVELSHYLFIFRLVGKNDTAYLNSIAAGLGDMVNQLMPFEFVVVTPDRRYWKNNPI